MAMLIGRERINKYKDTKGGGGMDIGKTKKKTKKKDPFRADKTTSLNREFSKRTARANREAMKNVKKKAKGGSLNPLPSAGENPGLRKLPTEVRNKMGYMKKGGKVMKMRGGGAATRGVNFKVM